MTQALAYWWPDEGDGEKVVDWLDKVENDHARRAMNGGMPPFDCGRMWEELTLSARRA